MDRTFTRKVITNNNSRIDGKDRTEPIYCHADRMFPNSPDVLPIAYLKGFYCTSPYLMKNDLNGHFPYKSTWTAIHGDNSGTCRHWSFNVSYWYDDVSKRKRDKLQI